MDGLLPIASPILTGIIVGLATWRVSANAMRRDELRRMRRDSLTRLAGNRYDLRGAEFTRALNAACIVWSEAPAVMESLKAFQAAVLAGEESGAQEAILRLLRAMGGELGLALGELSDEFLLTPFNTLPTSQEERRR